MFEENGRVTMAQRSSASGPVPKAACPGPGTVPLQVWSPSFLEGRQEVVKRGPLPLLALGAAETCGSGLSVS